MTEEQLLNGVMVWIVAVMIVGRIVYYQDRIRTGDVSWPNVDPMPRLGEVRAALEESGRSWRSSITLGRGAEAGGSLLAGLAMSVFVGIFVHPVMSLVLFAAIVFQTAVDIYQWVSVDLGLMRAKWGWWLRDTKVPD